MLWVVSYILVGIIICGTWIGMMNKSEMSDILNDELILVLPLIWPLVLIVFCTCAVAGLVSGIKAYKDELNGNGKPES